MKIHNSQCGSASSQRDAKCCGVNVSAEAVPEPAPGLRTRLRPRQAHSVSLKALISLQHTTALSVAEVAVEPATAAEVARDPTKTSPAPSFIYVQWPCNASEGAVRAVRCRKVSNLGSCCRVAAGRGSHLEWLEEEAMAHFVHVAKASSSEVLGHGYGCHQAEAVSRDIWHQSAQAVSTEHVSTVGLSRVLEASRTLAAHH